MLGVYWETGKPGKRVWYEGKDVSYVGRLVRGSSLSPFFSFFFSSFVSSLKCFSTTSNEPLIDVNKLSQLDIDELLYVWRRCDVNEDRVDAISGMPLAEGASASTLETVEQVNKKQ